LLLPPDQLATSPHALPRRRARSSLRTSIAMCAFATAWPSLAAAAAPSPSPDAAATSTGAVLADGTEDGGKRDEIIVTGAHDAEHDKQKLDKVVGTATVVLNSDVERGRSANAEDLLAFVPGVFAAATSGTSANKISIRGSGLATFYQGYSLGIRYLYDGLPFTGPGGTQEDLLNAAAVNYTEILNGSNAFSYGAISLGGAINYVTRSGRSAPGLYLSTQFGSYGYQKYEGSFGGLLQDGATDYYFYAAHNRRHGYQQSTPNSGEDYIFNIGHKFNDHLETRFILRHRREDLLNGSTLTLSQIRTDPTHNNLVSGRLKNGTTLLESKTTYTFDDNSKIDVGINFNDFPLLNGWKTTSVQYWRSKDITGSLRYTREGDHIFGLSSDTSLVYTDTRSILADVTGYNVVNGKNVFKQYVNYTGAHDTVWAATNNLHLIDDRLTLSTGLSLINIGRNSRIGSTILTNATTYPTRVKYNLYYVAPRAGLLFQPTAHLQFFGNVTRSIDPPVTWQMGSTSNAYLYDLKPQKAWTAEIGGRIHTSTLEGGLTFYRSWVRDELLTVVVVPPSTANPLGVTANSNASPTIHQGIEASLDWTLWRDDAGNDVQFRNSYTHNAFSYRHDSVYGHNQLPSLPRHFYQGELLFEQKVGFYFGVDLRYLSHYYVDFANSLRAPSAAIWGAKAGYQTAKGWRLFVDLKNLGNKRYATATNTAYNLKGVDSPNFYVGDGFSVYGGVSLKF
jgi:iron complex outermembrane receptor protein